ncbi:acyclic terpene utilization AtuA family protein [Solimonas flava]|uniref:acyclic terpene utilization AtuA family protein n=1 Tax=Solimonas flava TaxID=415849 RepID=UPI00041702CC|nr:acyclic terpene utilization AtuA family protein [Solimonas flava]
MKDVIRIGCGAGFWGDSAEGPRQLVESGEIDYLVLDYLAEITMSLLAKARAKDANLGYATDFPDVIARLAPQIKARGIKVVSNAGGVNPQACRELLQQKLKAQGIELSIGIVEGDDLLAQAASLKDVPEMFTGAAFPAKPWSVNAYLGAFPIAAALDAGADIVITGRCVDSAVALGPLIHEFGWRADDYDQLAMGSLAGHIVECGVQATGGIVTDWATVADDWDRMGFPIAICHADGRFEVSKPAGTGGKVTPETVAEQIVYEIGDPATYLLPDVSCDFREVRLVQAGPDRVAVSGARGRAPTDRYKVSATYQDGFRATGTMMLGGPGAVDKAQAVARAVLKRTRRLFAERGLADYTRTDVEVLGAESNWGAQARARATREVVLKLAVQHADKNALEIFSREFIPAATAMAQSITGFSGGRPGVTPLVRLFSCLVPKSSVTIRVDVDGRDVPFTPAAPAPDAVRPAATPAPAAELPAGPRRQVPLLALAYGRSGDKGNAANIGVLARRAEFVPLLRAQLTAEAVRRYFAHFVEGAVERFELPGLNGFNFLMQDALGGGGVASLRYDPQGKMLAQILMDFPLEVPEAFFEQGLLAA